MMNELAGLLIPVTFVLSTPGALLIASATNWTWKWSAFAPALLTYLLVVIGGIVPRITKREVVAAIASLTIPAHALTLLGSIWMVDGSANKQAPTLEMLVFGPPVFALGLTLLLWTNLLFVLQGKGTLSPSNPPSHLVVTGPYAHVRNPMITGVLFMLVGMTLLAGGLPRMIAFATWFFVAKSTYFMLEEEPTLKDRFGKEYSAYCERVHRWVPKVQPYIPKE